jgi:hypothetical protein
MMDGTEIDVSLRVSELVFAAVWLVASHRCRLRGSLIEFVDSVLVGIGLSGWVIEACNRKQSGLHQTAKGAWDWVYENR